MTLFFQTLKVVFLEILADFFYFPIWWYTKGFWTQIKGIFNSLKYKQDSLAIGIWIKNIGKPMYGQYDMTGRIISFFARVAQIIGRTFILVIWAIILVVWLVIWLLIPVAIVYLIYAQATNFL